MDLEMSNDSSGPVSWWGQFELDVDNFGFWQIGPLSLWAHRAQHEWRLSFARSRDRLADALAVEVPGQGTPPPDDATAQRFGFDQSPARLRLRPALPDRPVVIAPESPFSLPPRETAALYVGLPLWIEVFLGDGDTPLLDEPVFRPSDTWFGSSTLRGELCYAARTSARLTLANVPVRPHRAFSEIRIRNTAKTLLTVDRIRIPCREMTLYTDSDSRLWTNTVTLERKTDTSDATVSLQSGPPAIAANTAQVGPPRVPATRVLSIPVFTEMLRLGG